MVLPNLTTVETNYNPKLQKNAKVIFKRKDQEDRWKVTEQERSYARKSKYPKDLHDFSSQVCVLFFRKKEVRFPEIICLLVENTIASWTQRRP